jgi:predicted Rossmann-fold nucleotide-binding protein
MDELFESLTLIQTGKLENFPVILFGTRYWTPLIDWMGKTMFADGCIDDQDLRRLALTDDPATVVRWLGEAGQGECHLDGGVARCEPPISE